MKQRALTLACVTAAFGAALTGPALANATPACPDVHVIGAAGSGERTDADLVAYQGMGRPVYQSLQELTTQVQQDGRTVSYEAVDYPAVEAPGAEGGVGAWMNFMSSVDAGTNALADQYHAFAAQCPTSKVVLAGYSQGAMVVHRNLSKIGGDPNVTAALLIADGDRRPDDATLNFGTVDSVPGRGKGAAQDWPILAHAPSQLPADIAAKTISVCDLNDAVCDYRDIDTTPAEYQQQVVVHTSYARSAGLPWTAPLYALLNGAPVPAEAQQIVPLSGSTPTG